MRQSIATALFCSAVLALFSGCASTSGRSSSESTVTGLNNLRADVTAGKQQIETTMNSLMSLEKAGGGDLKPLYDTFQKELKSLESLASRARSHSQSMREKGTAFFKTWEEQLGTMTNPDIRKRSDERRNELNEQYTKLTDSMDVARQAYDKFSTDLTEIKNALGLDLSANGVKKLSKPFDVAGDHASELTKALDGVDKRLDALASEMNTIQAVKS
jgi:hypothetical protein